MDYVARHGSGQELQKDPSRHITVIGSYVAAIIHALEARGVPTDTILQVAGLPRVPSNDPLDRVAFGSLCRLSAAAVDMSRDPHFGLYAARFVHASTLHAVGYAMLAGSSLRDVLERLLSGFLLISNITRPTLRPSNDGATLEFPCLAILPPATEDMFMLALVQLIGEISNETIRPVRVELNRLAPQDGGTRHQNEFHSDVHFGAANPSITFGYDVLERPLAGANRELAEANDRIVVTYLARLSREDIAKRVQAILLEELASGRITKKRVANKLCMSARTLQVKLLKSRTTFQNVVNETRHALACGYIANSAMSITEIAYLLGFSDTSNFSRAFRRWTGHSPSAYADQLRQGSHTPVHLAGAPKRALIAVREW